MVIGPLAVIPLPITITPLSVLVRLTAPVPELATMPDEATVKRPLEVSLTGPSVTSPLAVNVSGPLADRLAVPPPVIVIKPAVVIELEGLQA